MFVYEQISMLAGLNSNSEFYILAPYDYRLKNINNNPKKNIHVIYFKYICPRTLCQLNAEGIWPAIKHRPLKVTLLPLMVIFFIFNAIYITTKVKPNLIYAHWLTPQAIVACITSIITRTPFSFTSHASDAEILHKLPFFGNMIVKLCTNRAKSISVVSSRTETKLKSFFTENEWLSVQSKLEKIPMGTSIEKSEETTLTPDSPYILFVGRLAEKKGLEYLLKGFKTFSEFNPNYTLKIAGLGPLREKLENLVTSLKLDGKVSMIGYVDGRIKQSLINKCSIYIVPSIITDDGDAEGLPVSLLEGMSAGKVCIATRESGGDEIIAHNHNGFLIDQKDSDEISKALYVVSTLNKSSLATIRNNALQTAKNYNWDKIGMRYNSFLKRASNDEENTDNK